MMTEIKNTHLEKRHSDYILKPTHLRTCGDPAQQSSKKHITTDTNQHISQNTNSKYLTH